MYIKRIVLLVVPDDFVEKYSFHFNGTILLLILPRIFLHDKEMRLEFYVCLLDFLHFSSSENAGDEINEDSQHVSFF